MALQDITRLAERLGIDIDVSANDGGDFNPRK
jgi:hypothetical protein